PSGWRALDHSCSMPETSHPTHRRDLLEGHVTTWRLRREHRALFRGVYISREADVDVRTLAQAALLRAESGAYVSHYTAALMWGGVVPDDPDIHLSYPRNRARCSGISAHRQKEGQEAVTFRGIHLTSPIQTFLDMAHVLSLVDLVVLGD